MPSEQNFLVLRFSTAGDEQLYPSITVQLKLQTDTNKLTTLKDSRHQDKISIQHDTRDFLSSKIW
jgi:hypothetical protein